VTLKTLVVPDNCLCRLGLRREYQRPGTLFLLVVPTNCLPGKELSPKYHQYHLSMVNLYGKIEKHHYEGVPGKCRYWWYQELKRGWVRS